MLDLWRLYVASQVITEKGKFFLSEFARCFFLGLTLPRSDRKRVWSNSGLMATSFQDPWRFVHSFDAPLWFHRKAGSNVCMSLLFFFGGFFCKVQLLIEDAVATTTGDCYWLLSFWWWWWVWFLLYILISIRLRMLVFLSSWWFATTGRTMKLFFGLCCFVAAFLLCRFKPRLDARLFWYDVTFCVFFLVGGMISREATFEELPDPNREKTKQRKMYSNRSG